MMRRMNWTDQINGWCWLEVSALNRSFQTINHFVMRDFLFFRSEKIYFKLRFSEILYIHAAGKHIAIVTAGKTYISSVAISYIEQILPSHLFCRIHRSYIISLEHTDKFDHEMAYVGTKKIPIADHCRKALKKSVTTITGDIQSFILDNGEGNKLLKRIASWGKNCLFKISCSFLKKAVHPCFQGVCSWSI